MKATIRKWGSSLALRIPNSLAQELRIRAGSTVAMAVRSGELVVDPGESRASILARMLKRITRANRHVEQDWGAPVGRESVNSP